MKILLKRRLASLCVFMLVCGTAAAFYVKSSKPKSQESPFKLSDVDKGRITQTITANGTINPVALVNVGSQVSGTVSELHADFNDKISMGAVLLKLDPTIFNAQIRQAEASEASAQAALRLAQSIHLRNQTLVEKGFVSPLSLDQSRKEVDVAEANVKLARAQLARAEADLSNSVIRSPIDGIVIKRSVDLGQTLAASFTTPNLFQIAKDLTKMQIDTNVSEADIGGLRQGQEARFVVDAYPDKEFAARMRQFRLAATTSQNVVTYNVVLDVDNPDLLLKPGMTAQVRLVVGSHENAVRLPTAALRFRPSNDGRSAADKRGADQSAALANPDDDDLSNRGNGSSNRIFRVYKLGAANEPIPVDIQIGLSNFRFTEVASGQLHPGDKIIIRAIGDKKQ